MAREHLHLECLFDSTCTVPRARALMLWLVGSHFSCAETYRHEAMFHKTYGVELHVISLCSYHCFNRQVLCSVVILFAFRGRGRSAARIKYETNRHAPMCCLNSFYSLTDATALGFRPSRGRSCLIPQSKLGLELLTFLTSRNMLQSRGACT